MKTTLNTAQLLLALVCSVALLAGCQVAGPSNAPDEINSTAADLSTLDIYQAKADEAVVFYKRADGNYDGWGLHLWDTLQIRI